MTISKLSRISFISSVAILSLVSGLPALAAGESVQVQYVSPTGTISPGTTVMFSVAASGFVDPVYAVSDPFGVSGATIGTIDKVGFFTWTPGIYDAGRHTITVTVTDSSGHSATTTVTILIASTTVVVSNLSPGPTVVARHPVTLSVAAPGFVTPQYAVYDSSAASSLNSSNITAAGAFSWTPTTDDIGAHLITIAASDPYGHNAQAVVNITVVNQIASTSAATSTPAAPPAPTPVPATIATSQTPPTAATTKKYLFTANLAIGARGTPVLELQKRLTALGFYAGPLTGTFGPLTSASVKKFQSAHGLPRVGTVGPATRAALNAN